MAKTLQGGSILTKNVFSSMSHEHPEQKLIYLSLVFYADTFPDNL